MEALPTPKRRYITQLDALRFFAAFLTAAFHGDILKLVFASPDRPLERDWSHLGANCVTFFFVLSGFVITWLLLGERARSHTVDVTAFYMRRVFRIWPLYYLIVALGLFVVPHLPGLFLPDRLYSDLAGLTGGALFMWLTFFPNLSKVEWIVPQLLASHTWSIGMEEQFYAFWPWLVKKIRRPEWGMLIILGLFLILRYLVCPFMPSWTFVKALEYFRFDCMAVGGLVAAYYYHGHWQTRPTFLQNPAILYALAIACLVLTLMPDPMPRVYYFPILSVLYGALILALALQPYRMDWLNHPALRYLGAISYGIYMYNVLACVLAINVMQRLGGGTLHLFVEAPVLSNLIYYTLCLGLTVGMSALSYRFLETPFLRLKDRLAQPRTLVESSKS